MPKQQSQSWWMKRHLKDPYVKQAQLDHYPSRAAYKLLQIDEKNRLFRKGMTVVDLGAAPGGWSVVARDAVTMKGRIFAVDRLEMSPISGVEVIQGDFTEEATYEALLARMRAEDVETVGGVLSDMSPNLTGHKGIDQPRSIYLAELGLDFAQKTLSSSGFFLCKVFQGAGIDELALSFRSVFKQIKWCKPKASRERSREVYLLGRKLL